MALWLASFPDGAYRRRAGDGRVHLNTPEWLTAVLDGQSAQLSSKALWAKGGGNSEMRERFVHGLIKVGQPCKEYNGWSTCWSRGEQLLWDFLRRPKDAYAVAVLDKASCARPELITHSFVREQKSSGARTHGQDSNIHDARRSHFKHKFLIIGDWAGYAGEVQLRSDFHFSWSFEQDQDIDHDDEVLALSDSDQSDDMCHLNLPGTTSESS